MSVKFNDVVCSESLIIVIVRVDYTCPGNCSGRGECRDDGICLCDIGWFGELCDLPVCPNNCSSNGKCDETSSICYCSPGYTGG